MFETWPVQIPAGHPIFVPNHLRPRPIIRRVVKPALQQVVSQDLTGPSMIGDKPPQGPEGEGSLPPAVVQCGTSCTGHIVNMQGVAPCRLLAGREGGLSPLRMLMGLSDLDVGPSVRSNVGRPSNVNSN